MSSCSVITFKDGQACDYLECRNSWLGAMRIWTSLFDRYVKDPLVEYDNVLSRFGTPRIDELWDLWKRSGLSMCERAVHLATMDWFTVKQENFQRFATHLLEFSQMYPGPSHLLTWSDFIRSLTADVEAIAFHHTSVIDNPWCRDGVPHDLRTMKSFEVYTVLSKAGYPEGV